MELAKTPRVYFDETTHSYLLDDKVLLSGVTSLLKKHNLSADYGDVPEAVLKKAAEEGTAIHREIQNYEKGEVFFASPLIDEYKNLIALHGYKFVAAEYQVTDYELVASAIDMVYESAEGVVIADIKTTQKYHRRPVEFQLGIYKYLFERLNPGIPVVGCLCIWIDKKKQAVNGFIPVSPVSADEVSALLDAERNGIIYIDNNDTPSLGEALAPGEAEQLAANAGKIAELEATLKILKQADEAIREKLLRYMEDNGLDKITAPEGTFTIKKAYTTTRVDSAALKKNYPAVYAKVTKESKVGASLTYKPNKS